MESIVAEHVEKYFYLQHQKTLKELVQALFFRKKTLERVHALKNISFDIKRGETVGIIGKNGAGKSTLLKLIAGVSIPTSGNLSVNGTIAPLIELGAGFHPELTGRENIFLNGVILGLNQQYIKKIFADIVAFAELKQFIDTPVKFYSSGMYMRLAFSVAVFTNPNVLLVDEILAVGDTAFQQKCMRRMAEFKKNNVTIILVSHALETVRGFCERVLYLKEGNLIYDGATEKGIDRYLKEG